MNRRLGRYAPLAVLALGFLALEGLLRLALLVRVWPRLQPAPAEIGAIFAVGLGYDVAALLAPAALYALYLALVPAQLHASRAGRALVQAGAAAAIFLALVTAVAEWLFWSEFGSRFNFIAIDYLVYTREVVGNLFESYPLVPLLGTLLAASLLASLTLRKVLSAACRAPTTGRARLAAAGVALAALGALAVFEGPAAQVSENRYAVQLAENGLYELFSAFRHNDLDYPPFYASLNEDEALRAAHRLLAHPGARFAGDDDRELARAPAAAGPERRWNVVLIAVESLSADFLGAYGNRQGLTPNLDRLAEESLVFDRLYATGTRTVRGLEAISLSIPPTPGLSIVRRPSNGGLFTLGTPFLERGYDVKFLYGGYGFFDDMNAFFGGNGFSVVDRTAFSANEIHFANVWGVADEDLLGRVTREADASHAAGRPFFSFVMTTSNHRPYTYPAGRVPIPSGTGRAGAVQYTDFAIGEFLRRAATRPWFDDTVFVIVADHCHSSAGKTDIPVSRYRIPMLIYAPGKLAPGRVETLASQIDVGPTLLALLRWGYSSRFFGRDILTTPPAAERALLGTYERLGLLSRDRLTVLSPGRKVESFRVDLARRTEQRIAPDPDATAAAIAWYQSASFAWRRGLLRTDAQAPAPAQPGVSGRRRNASEPVPVDARASAARRSEARTREPSGFWVSWHAREACFAASVASTSRWKSGSLVSNSQSSGTHHGARPAASCSGKKVGSGARGYTAASSARPAARWSVWPG
jgi:phosphoglycerol transferase MdoB-like AlkP superfamily enzyme